MRALYAFAPMDGGGLRAWLGAARAAARPAMTARLSGHRAGRSGVPRFGAGRLLAPSLVVCRLVLAAHDVALWALPCSPAPRS